MFLDIVLTIVGLALVVFGADWLVEGSSGIARKLGVSEFVIGLTIVGFGTSMPELVVSLTGAISGNSDVAAGNVIGSNIFNSLLILGVTGLLSPIAITSSNKKRDIPIMFGVTVLFVVVGLLAGEISQIVGFVFIVIFAVYIFFSFKLDDKSQVKKGDEGKDRTALVDVAVTAAGLAGLIFGGRMFVNNSVDIAHSIGVSDKFIAITLLAGGTSLPELVTSVVACLKKKGQLALGNILGSNVFNILLILGISAGVNPISLSNIDVVDMAVLLMSAVLIFTSIFIGKKNTIDRFDSAILLLTEVAYMAWLIFNIS